MDLLNLITKSLMKTINSIAINKYEDIEFVKVTQFKVLYLIFTILNYLEISPYTEDIDHIINDAYDKKLIAESMKDYYHAKKNYVNEMLYNICHKVYNAEHIDVVALYQQLLSYLGEIYQ